MSEFNSIKNGFEKAGLTIVKRDKPGGMGVGAKRAFFCEIRKVKNHPVFCVWPGAEENLVQVISADPSWKQIVLLVKEKATTIKMRQYDYKARKYVINEVKVPENKRKFLLGFDERDLFMAQLPSGANVTTVKQAHDMLRNPALSKNKKDKVIRQGEWFFRPVTREEQILIDTNENIIDRNCRINKKVLRGKPHTAAEYLEIHTTVDPVTRAIVPGSMFARGRISHADHASLNLRSWHRVYSNMEDRSADARWID